MARINLGSGNEPLAGWINLDRRRCPGVSAIGDVRRLPFRSAAIAEVNASSVLEHFEDPYAVLDEIHRVLAPGGRVRVRVPSPWSVWGVLDRTHVFLADLRLWREILEGYFEDVSVESSGARYRDSTVLRAITFALVKGLRWHELAEAWVFECRGKRDTPSRRYIPWWLEDASQ